MKVEVRQENLPRIIHFPTQSFEMIKKVQTLMQTDYAAIHNIIIRVADFQSSVSVLQQPHRLFIGQNPVDGMSLEKENLHSYLQVVIIAVVLKVAWP